MAFVGTAIAFGCFSGAAIIAKRREYLYLGGLLSSGLSILLWLQFATSIFGHTSATFMFEVNKLAYTLQTWSLLRLVIRKHATELIDCIIWSAALLRPPGVPGIYGV